MKPQRPVEGRSCSELKRLCRGNKNVNIVALGRLDDLNLLPVSVATPINNSAYSELHYGFVVNNTKYSSEIDSIQKMEQIILKSLLIYTYFEMHNLDFLTMGHKCNFFHSWGTPQKVQSHTVWLDCWAVLPLNFKDPYIKAISTGIILLIVYIIKELLQRVPALLGFGDLKKNVLPKIRIIGTLGDPLLTRKSPSGAYIMYFFI